MKLFAEFFASRGGGTFYDLGANIGMGTVLVAQDARVNCVCFEPDPGNFALLRANVLLNCAHGNVETINAAVAQERGQLRFETSHYNCGDDHLSADGSLVVQAMRLDDYPPRTMPLAVQIDCQGAEPTIIKGGMQALGKADLIVFEFWPWRMRRIGLSPGPILDFVSGQFPFAHVLHHDQPTGAPKLPSDATETARR